MERQDFWTLVVAAVAVFLASLPKLLDSARGVSDNYGGFRWLLVIGPVAMVVLAGFGRWARSRRSGGGEEA